MVEVVLVDVLEAKAELINWIASESGRVVEAVSGDETFVDEAIAVEVVVGEDEERASSNSGRLDIVVDDTSGDVVETLEEARAESIILMASESGRAIDVVSVDEELVDEVVVAEAIEVVVADEDEASASSI